MEIKVFLDIAEKVLYFLVSVRFIPIAVAILAWVLFLVFSKRYRDKAFYMREIVRHKKRTYYAIKQLVSSPYTDYAFASLAWSQSDLMSIYAQHGMSKEQKQSLGGLYALALNIPLQHAKRTLFTEKPRSLISPMDENTAEKIQDAIQNLSSSRGSNVKLSSSLFNIIAYNQLVYHIFPQRNLDINQSDFYCVHPRLLPNEKMRDDIREILSSHKQTFMQMEKDSRIGVSKTGFELLRETASRLQQTIKWEFIYERDEVAGNFDPRVSFVLKIISFLAHMTRSRPCYLLENDFLRIHHIFLHSITIIFENCEKLLKPKDEDFGNSTNIYVKTCESLSENLLVIFDLLGLDFPLLSNCVERQRGKKNLDYLPLSPKVFKPRFFTLRKLCLSNWTLF